MPKSIYDPEYRKIIDVLRDARTGLGMSQQVLADRLKRPQSFVAKVEGYERRLDVAEFIQVCRALGVEPALVFGLAS